MKVEVENPNLFPCPDCGHLCSKAAQVCPNCGRPHIPAVPAVAAPETTVISGSNLYDYVFRNSLMMVGLCLTLLGLVRLVEGLKHFGSMGDELLAANSVIFLASALISYFALKQPDSARRKRIGRTGDLMFTLGVLFLLMICLIVALSAA